MNIKEILKENLLLEEKLRVQSLKTGFNKILPSGTNYVDAHAQLPVFGTRWGRGVLVKSKNGYDAIIGPYGSSHSRLKSYMQSGELTAGTFYYGYDSSSKTLYLEYGSDRTFDFNNKNCLNAIMDALKTSNGVMKDFVLVRG